MVIIVLCLLTFINTLMTHWPLSFCCCQRWFIPNGHYDIFLVGMINCCRAWTTTWVLLEKFDYKCTKEEISGHSLQWRHNGCDNISNHQPHDCLLIRRSKKTSKLHVTGLCAGNSPVPSEFSAQMASNAENVSIWWCCHVYSILPSSPCVTLRCWIHSCVFQDVSRH